MTRKGGGRESGPTGDTGVVRATETGRAAANLAANPHPDWAFGIYRSHDAELHERIRELEAAEHAYKAANESQYKTIARLDFALQKALHARESRIPLELQE